MDGWTVGRTDIHIHIATRWEAVVNAVIVSLRLSTVGTKVQE